jgi:DNA repair protein RadC
MEIEMNTIRNEDAAPYTAARKGEENALKRAEAILLSRLKDRPHSFTDPDAAKLYLRIKLQELEYEEFWVLFLDNQHRLIEPRSMFRGTIDGASVYPRVVAKAALDVGAAAVIFAHNHPSGISEPSQADRAITSKLKDALGLFDIRVLDHFIVGETVYAFSENGLI